MTTVLAILQFVTIAALAWLIYNQRRFAVDPKRLADGFAARLLRNYADNIHLLDEEGTKQWVRSDYLELCSEIGLPEAPVEQIQELVWQRIEIAQGVKEPGGERRFNFYE